MLTLSAPASAMACDANGRLHVADTLGEWWAYTSLSTSVKIAAASIRRLRALRNGTVLYAERADDGAVATLDLWNGVLSPWRAASMSMPDPSVALGAVDLGTGLIPVRVYAEADQACPIDTFAWGGGACAPMPCLREAPCGNGSTRAAGATACDCVPGTFPSGRCLPCPELSYLSLIHI